MPNTGGPWLPHALNFKGSYCIGTSKCHLSAKCGLLHLTNRHIIYACGWWVLWNSNCSFLSCLLWTAGCVQIHLNTALHLLLLLYKNEWKTGNKMLITAIRRRGLTNTMQPRQRCFQDREAGLSLCRELAGLWVQLWRERTRFENDYEMTEYMVEDCV